MLLKSASKASADHAGLGTVLDEFTIWCRDELFTPTMIQAARLVQRACDLHLEQLYRSLDLARHLAIPKTAAELTEELGFVESAAIALEAALLCLADRTALVRADLVQEPPRFTAAGAGTDRAKELEEVRYALCSLGNGYAAAIEFLDFGAEKFVEALQHDPELMDRVLTGRDARFRELWHRATNEDPLQNAHGIMGARLIEQLFGGGCILEVGGGTGNGMRHLMRHFAAEDALSRLERYIFTDISFNFVVATREEMMKAYPSVNTEWRYLDMNRTFSEQKFRPGSVDLIYGVNAAHCARDIVGLLQQCRVTLRDRGKAVFAERVRMEPRQMAARELTLNLSTYHRTAAIRNPDYRPIHGYLAPGAWLRVCQLAGFSAAQVYPDLAALSPGFADQYAAVIVADK